MTTGDNDLFMRSWFEVSHNRSNYSAASQSEAVSSGAKWFPYSKGGEFRKWYGNNDYVLNWENGGQKLKANKPKTILRNPKFYFRSALTWSLTSSLAFGARLRRQGALFDVNGMSGFFEKENLNVLALLNSKVCAGVLRVINPTRAFQSGDIERIPFLKASFSDECRANSDLLLSISADDWDAYETSWDFTTLPLLAPDHRSGTLGATYARLRAHWAGMTEEMKRLEEENNRIFIDAYGLQDELTPEVPIEEITLTCNPAYRYGVKGTEEEREARLLADTMKELISYAIGCMFGRYSLDAPGLILANQGDTAQTYLDRIPEPTFAPDRDNVIPLFEEDWFADDAYQRFREFLSVTFGADRLVENLEFMRAALGKEVRTYLAKDFYADHVQRYKKRPIYWLVSSPKGAFQALIYMHRYTPDTLNITLNDYVRGLRDRLEAALRAAKATEISPDATPAEKNRAKRDIDRFTKQIAEVTEWERDTLYPLAVERIRIDLDDGVKRNYPKFPGVLRPIKGLEDEDA